MPEQAPNHSELPSEGTVRLIRRVEEGIDVQECLVFLKGQWKPVDFRTFDFASLPRTTHYDAERNKALLSAIKRVGMNCPEFRLELNQDGTGWVQKD